MNLNTKKLSTYQHIVVLASIIPIIVFGFLTYQNSKKEAIEITSQHIQSINQEKKQLVLDYFKEIEFNSNTLTKSVSFLQKQATQNIINIQNLQKNNIKDYYHSVENEILSLAKKDIFQYIFSFRNRGKKVSLQYLQNIYEDKKDLDIKNILMIKKTGEVIYSSDEEKLLHKNVQNINKSFHDVWQKIKNLDFDGKETVYFVNFGYDTFTQSYKQYAISPFKDVQGYIALEIDFQGVQKIIQNVDSLGKTAETYLVYKEKDKTYLASNRKVKTGKIGDEKSGIFIDKGFEESGYDIKYGSIGEIELLGYMPIKIKNIIMSMQTTVAYTEVISPVIKGADYFKQFIIDYGYHNIMLVGPKGDIFYTVEKEEDFQTNILTGKYSNTHLAQAVQKVFKTKKFVLTDIDYYTPCPNIVAQFALLPIIKTKGEVQTVVVMQIGLHKLSDILKVSSDVYKTKETYIVGSDKKLRSDTMLNAGKYNVLNSYTKELLVDTQTVRDAQKTDTAISNIKDYRGIGVFSSYSTIDFEDFKWTVITEIDEAEINEMISGLKYNILIFIFISSLVALVVMLFITNEKKKQDAKIHHSANHDSLTGLPNRKFALEFLDYLLSSAKRSQSKGAVFFIDLDRFKVINDSYGHKAGDHVLKVVSSRLKDMLREDDLLARLGGDEFIVVINSYSKVNDLDILCKKIISNISEPIKDESRVYQVGLSIGIATFPDDSDNADELLQFADTAMFKTKDNGRNNFTYYNKDMTEHSLQVARVESELAHAIKNNELVLHYQPQVDIKINKIIGVEALVRWNHPSDGLVMPNDFIPIAEESDLIVELGRWVVREACSNFKKWKEQGVELNYIAVNMSARQLQCKGCVENIKEIVRTLDFNPQWLELEITETTLISNFESTLSSMDIFKEMGIKFSIDDFGTGYSSLSYLKSLHIATLKIDREFIKDIIADKDDRSIVSAIIAMGHMLNYTIVAEGAETKAEVELLKHLACDVIQGYFFSKPLSEKDLLEYIQKEI